MQRVDDVGAGDVGRDGGVEPGRGVMLDDRPLLEPLEPETHHQAASLVDQLLRLCRLQLGLDEYWTQFQQLWQGLRDGLWDGGGSRLLLLELVGMHLGSATG